MPLRSSRFYLFGYHHYYGHIRLPRLPGGLPDTGRVSHVHALPSLCTQPYFTPESSNRAFYRFFRFDGRLRQLRQIGHSYWCNEAYGAAYNGVCPELNAVRFLAASQGNFNPNDKFDCKVLSSL